MSNIATYTNPNAPLELNSISLDENYAKKWNEHMRDFKLLCKEGKPLRNTLYRLGGMGSISDLKNDYFMLLKYVESVYSFDFIKKCYPNKNRKELELQRNHLEGRWTILDRFGNEKIEFPNSLDYPYLKGGVIYTINKKYYNIETGYCYGEASASISSDEYLFIENNYDKDKSKRGVVKIHKETGIFEFFPKK